MLIYSLFSRHVHENGRQNIDTSIPSRTCAMGRECTCDRCKSLLIEVACRSCRTKVGSSNETGKVSSTLAVRKDSICYRKSFSFRWFLDFVARWRHLSTIDSFMRCARDACRPVIAARGRKSLSSIRRHGMRHGFSASG